MSSKVFYAWQSDCDQQVCHYFIRDALKMALKKITKSDTEAKVTEADRPELDHDRNGVPGTPRIAETIERKIKAAAVFVADLTAVTGFTTYDERSTQTPNANVLIELGMAFRAVKSERIILVMNTAFGSPDGLPFDLKDRSHPIKFNLNSKSDPDCKAKLAKLADDLVEPLKLCLENYASKVLASKTEKPQAQGEQQKLAAEQRWKDFIERLKMNKFAGLRISRVTVTGPGLPPPEEPPAHAVLSIVPLKPIVQRLELGGIYEKAPGCLRPLRSSGWNRELHGSSIIYHDGSSRRSRQGDEPTTAVELKDDGCVLAAFEVPIGTAAGQGRFIAFEMYERVLFSGLVSFVSGLRELKVADLLELRMGLIGCNHCYLFPHRPFYWDDDSFRKLETEFLEVGPVVVADNASPSIEDMAELFKSDLMKMWRNAGLARDPSYDQNGHFVTNPSY